ncbi:ribosomal protein S18-alanine N-acetyltransferase [Crinalium epipsammum]|uniref:ribosomal protein S18-alanine N-acetyltransferase n=1 Tax=Crinalium epipsammum TaxID=241425 RepID=UPI000303EEC0|nr:ribosomal protein S18-alanine N-acetyltransferase [Crinalium epipsammum]
MSFLELKPLKAEQLPAVVELDQLCFGGHWTLDGYRRELESSSSHFLTVCLSSKSVDCKSQSNYDLETSNNSQSGQLTAQQSNALNSNSLGVATRTEAEIPSQLIGLGCFWSILEEAHITLLAVNPEYQNQGLGKLLFYGLLYLAHQQGLERATLEVRVSNQTALYLYKKFGFQEVGKRRRYYQDTGEDAVILWRNHLATAEFNKILMAWQQEIKANLDTKGWNLLIADPRFQNNKEF